MKKTINENEFAFDDHGHLSRAARRVLYDYYRDPEDDTGEDIAVCCGWAEYTAGELVRDYGYLLKRDEDQDEDDYLDALVEEIRHHSTVVLSVKHYGEPDTYLVHAF